MSGHGSTIVAEAPARGRMRGVRVFLSASVPDPRRQPGYPRGMATHLEVREAVVSLARAVFSEGGRLVFGGHPSISPLVALVAGEYIGRWDAEDARDEDPPVIIYQSRAFEGVVPAVTRLMEERGQARIRWTDAAEGEARADGRGAGSVLQPRSLEAMRARMLDETRPVAMVCVGGMKGVVDEARLFARIAPGKPVYVLESTSGASELLADGRAEMPEGVDIRVIDREVMDRLARGREATALRWDERAGPRPPPYPLIMQTIVRELVDREGREGG